MKNIILFGLIIFGGISCQTSPEHTKSDLSQFVDPFIGTGGVGHTMPGASYPLGLIQLSPNTGYRGWDYCSGYQYNDTLLYGFLHTHLNGGGGADLLDLLMLPFCGTKSNKEYTSVFSKELEKASPGYYSTILTTDKIKVELTVTERTGMHRYVFQKSGDRNVYISIDRILSRSPKKTGRTFIPEFYIENDNSLSGKYQSQRRVPRDVYFAIQFDKHFYNTENTDERNQRTYILHFGEELDTLHARVAISTVSIESAWDNLRAESIGNSFEVIHEDAKKQWNNYLSLITIEGTAQQKKLFYTSLYHLFIQPNNIADVNGDYRGADEEIHNSDIGSLYSTFALWDTYRGAFPLYSILVPDKNVEFIYSLLKHYDQVGYLPVWPIWGTDCQAMIGNHAAAVITDACLKDLPGIDKEKALLAITESLTKNHWPKYDWTLYDRYGYLPSDSVNSEAVSRTLEAAFDDWCAAQLAKHLDKQTEFEFFSKRAGFYKNLFDKETGFFRGKNSDGTWVLPFDPMEITHGGASAGDYTEGNAWQWLWSVQHDIEGLIELMGGKANFTAKLDSLFLLESVIYGRGSTQDVTGLLGQYAHGNEPSHHVIYLYNYIGQPHRTQEMVKEILKTMYKPKPDGISGNVDYGQMSAWYILSSLGFYPVNPASGIFDIGRPEFKYAKIKVGEKSFEIKTLNFSNENTYVKAVFLNGEPVLDYKLSYSDIVKGGEMLFEMNSSSN